jgi:hypothetical protein
VPEDPEATTIQCEYPLIQSSNQLPYHFIHGYRMFLSQVLGIAINPVAFKGDIHLTRQEKDWISQVGEITGDLGSRFWIIVSGGKTDFTAKWWGPDRAQAVVDHFQGRIQFVQCGEAPFRSSQTEHFQQVTTITPLAGKISSPL